MPSRECQEALKMLIMFCACICMCVYLNATLKNCVSSVKTHWAVNSSHNLYISPEAKKNNSVTLVLCLNFFGSCVSFNFLTMVLIFLTCYIKVLFILKTECWCLKISMSKASISIAWPYPRLCVSQRCWKPKDAQGLTQSLRNCTPFGKCFPD